jgi:hypothetical protein
MNLALRTLEDLYLRHRNYDPETPLISRASQYDFWLSLRVLEATTVMWSLRKVLMWKRIMIVVHVQIVKVILSAHKQSCQSAVTTLTRKPAQYLVYIICLHHISDCV